jgi:large subunit ribosomal protein L24
MAKIKRDDEVIIIAGRDKGKRGTVRQILDTGKLIVSGVNMIKKHTKPNPQAGVAGGIVEKEAPIQISNVAIYNADAGRGDRIGYKVEDGKKVRIYKSTGDAIDA